MSDSYPVFAVIYPSEFLVGKSEPYSIIGLSDSSTPPSTRYNDCRVIVNRGQILIGADSARGGQLVFKESVIEVYKEGQFTRVLTDTGKLVVFARSKGCGCGSRLRSWNPYGTLLASDRD